MSATSPRFRVGIGYDVHQLTTGRPLIIGGVEIPHTHGLDGHSDADVLSHAIADAILGALGKSKPEAPQAAVSADEAKIATWKSVRSEARAAG